jgi:hypothetical protein
MCMFLVHLCVQFAAVYLVGRMIVTLFVRTHIAVQAAKK